MTSAVSPRTSGRASCRWPGPPRFWSRHSADLVFGSGVDFDSRGEHELKGVPGRWSVHAVVADRRDDQRPASQATAEQAALTPSPLATMNAADRALVGASRAPRLSRFALRMVSRRPVSTKG